MREDVIHAYQKAELLYKNAPLHAFTNQDAVRLYQPWSRYAYEAYNYALAEETAVKLLNIGEKEGDPLLIGMAHIALSEACFLRFEFDVGLNLLEKALENLQRAEDQFGIILVYIRQAVLYWWKLQFEESRQTARQALTLINSYGELTPQLQQLSLNAEHVIGVSYYAQGEAKQCLEAANAIKQKYTKNLGPSEKTRIYYIQGYAHLISANYEQCIEDLTLSYDLANASNRMLIIEVSLYKLANAKLISGKLDQAYEHASKALEYGEKYDHIHAIVSANVILGSIFSNLENEERALQYFRVAQVRESFSSTSLHGIENEIQMAISFSKSGRIAEAKALIDSIKKLTLKFGIWQHYIRSLLIDQQFDLMSQNFDAANQKISSAIQLAQDKGIPYHLLWGKLAQASLFFLQGQGEFAAQNINEIIQKVDR